MTALLISLGNAAVLNAKQYNLKSPDGRTTVIINTSKPLTYSIYRDGEQILAPSPVSIALSNGKTVGKERIVSAEEFSTDETFTSYLYKKREIGNTCNELVLTCKHSSITFRAYDTGVAWRGGAGNKKPFKVKSDNTSFVFPGDWSTILAYSPVKGDKNEQACNSYENTYSHSLISTIEKDRLAFLPVVVESPKGKKVCITESDVLDYPGMFVTKSRDKYTIDTHFAAIPDETFQSGHKIKVKSRKSHIAEFPAGEVTFPWRIIIVADEDKDLLDNDLVYTLASEPQNSGDFDWVVPGKVAWDWWNAWNIKGVDFESGVNDDTYRHYIDFASANNIEYVILDEGWSVPGEFDLMKTVPEIHLEELVKYADERNVRLILWAGMTSFCKNTEEICRHYSEMGIKGFKVDFLERDDQTMVNFMAEAAATAAKYRLVLDFHGCCKPAGLQRTWPNVLNFEAVYGLENLKWAANADIVSYDVTMPFIRMVAGPVDYTPGAMRNAVKDNWHPVNSEPMSQGTRCHQIAEYIVFEAPLEMMCDSPSAYMAEQECTDFITDIPTVWDETIALGGEIGEYAVLARRQGGKWYVGALNNWEERTLTIDLSFLPEGKYTVEIFRDGVNSHRIASDYARKVELLPESRRLYVKLAPGGGAAIKIAPDTDSAIAEPSIL